MKSEHTLITSIPSIAARLRATDDTDGTLAEISLDICVLFEADRLTVYRVSEDRTLLVSKVKTGLNSFEDLKLPMSAEYSIAGYVALNRRLVNIRDVYDVDELNSHDPPVYFFRAVDRSTGYRTRQVLAAPVFDGADSGEVIGVAQLINTLSGNPFQKSAEERVVELCKALAAGFRQPQKTRQLGTKTKYDHLVIDGVITAAELELAIRLARGRGVNIEQVLKDELKVTDSALGLALSKFFGLPYEPFDPDRAKPTALLRKLKRTFVASQAWLPIAEDDQGMVIVTTDPERVISSRIVSQVFPRKKAAYRVCSNSEFAATVEHFYRLEGAPASVDTIIKRMDQDTSEPRSVVVEEKSDPDSATVQLVNKIIVEAHQMRASDIHVEPRQGGAKSKVRFRIDGSLVDYTDIPASHHAQVVARLKIMADLDIASKREPQDGKIAFKQFVPSLDIELRVATLPTVGGKEDVVMRILTAGRPVPLEQLGLSRHNLQLLKSLISKPYGLFLVCGPTGSGKTTTLHSVLGHINTPETKIWTAEDPVEITHESLRQVQINPRVDLTFARAMRAFLRADPDVIMVGEMRDKETAAIGIEASLTGHRVLATIHTNSAPESIVRLLDMGMDPFNFSDALLGIMAQRLAKRLCAKCKKPHVATQEEIRLMLAEYNQDLKDADRFKTDPRSAFEAAYAEWAGNHAYDKGQFILYEPAGCDACRGTGYSGRVALHELLAVTDAIKKNIQEHARVAEVLLTAVNEGMRTLKQDGMEKVLQGVMDMRAVRAVCIT
ncbi:MAG: GspE/PulE family protein [Betaproteobacteria bacterium]|nr:GspE/PulE family protein [Betaproteobacteria bacterium]